MCKISGVTIGMAIKRILKHKNMTQDELSRLTSLKKSYVSALATGKINNPRIDTVYKISVALGLTVTEFLKQVEDHCKT